MPGFDPIVPERHFASPRKRPPRILAISDEVNE
jgi:hypothetical protein